MNLLYRIYVTVRNLQIFMFCYLVCPDACKIIITVFYLSFLLKHEQFYIKYQ